MNVHVRLFTASALVALAALAVTGTRLSAQGAPFSSDTALAASALVSVVPTALVGTTGGASQTSAATLASPATPASEMTARGPRLSSARVASHAVSMPRGAPPVIQNNKSNKHSVALMIVGGAALIVGAVIGDDAGTLFMLGGAAVGLYGLYLFLT